MNGSFCAFPPLARDFILDFKGENVEAMELSLDTELLLDSLLWTEAGLSDSDWLEQRL